MAIRHAKDAFYKIKKFYPKYARNLTAKGKKKFEEKNQEYKEFLKKIDHEIPLDKKKYKYTDYRKETLKKRLIAFLNHLKKVLNYDDEEIEAIKSRI